MRDTDCESEGETLRTIGTIRLARTAVLCLLMVLAWALCASAQSAQPNDADQQSKVIGYATPVDTNDPPAMFSHVTDTRYWLSGQANFIFQFGSEL